MRINIENLDFAVIGLVIVTALLIGGLIIYVWVTDEDR
tara:strand:+ start:1273 stop:1386 length:114 start_codon:yes stop_codon:yes gene_type:complete